MSDAHEKTIVICSDGTGNDYTGTESNVLRLYGLALKDHPEQVACYDLDRDHSAPDGRTRLGRWARHSSELFFGAGTIETVTELYAYLMRQYRPGDRLFLFGFSRGAFTVRALACSTCVACCAKRMRISWGMRRASTRPPSIASSPRYEPRERTTFQRERATTPVSIATRPDSNPY